MINKNILKIRKNLDKLDNSFLKLIKKRTILVNQVIKNKKFIDIWWEDDGFKMPIVINYNSFDGLREKELELSNNPKKIVIPKSSELIIDPESWVLFEKKAYK